MLGNILEQEDIIKGLPDDYLYAEAEQPSGQLPPFLVVSEIQRRTDMRERYEATQDQPQSTITQQIVAEGLGGIPQAAPPMSPMDMASQTMGSPIPADPTSQVPVVAATGAPPPPTGGVAIGDSGLAGMGGQPQMGDFTQMVAGGGVVGMQQAGRVPRSKPASWWEKLVPFPIGENYPPANKYQRIGRAILDSRGKDWRTYPDDYIESVGRVEAQGFYDIPEDTGIGGLIQRAQEREGALDPEAPYWKQEGYVPPLDISDAYSGESYGGTGAISPEIASAQIQEESISGRRRSDLDEIHNDPVRFPAHAAKRASEGVIDDWDALSGPYRTAQLAKEKTLYGTLYTGRTAQAAGEGIVDMSQGFVGPYTDDPETQREGFVQKYITGPAATLSQSTQDWAQDFDMVESGVDAYNAAKNYLGDDLGLREWAQEFDMFEAGKNLHRSTNDLLGEYLPDSMTDQAIVEGARGGLGRVRDWWNAGYNRDGSDQSSWRDTFGKVVMDLQHPDAAPESVRDAGLETEADEAEAGGAGGAQFMPARQTPELGQLPVTDVQNTNAMGEDHKRRIEELSVSAEEDEATAMSEIESLITKTQDDARKDAFDAWMMNVGAGVASGDMAGGLEKGAIAISDIKKDARDAIRSLDATRLSRYFEGSKEELERAIALANVDANFATILVNAAIERGRGQRAYVSLIGDLLRYYESNMMGAEGYDDPSSIPTLAQRQASQMFDQNLPASVFNVNAGRITSGN